MPDHTIFSASIKGSERRLFHVQERSTTKDLTIVVKHARFAIPDGGFAANEADRVVEERYSVHRSPTSTRTNGIKYTRILGDGRRDHSYQYTEALKIYNHFSIVFIRRSGDISDENYSITKRHRGNIVSLGGYDPQLFQIVYMVLISNPDREFVMPQFAYVNCVHATFSQFRLSVLWQFMAFAGDLSTYSLVPKTFKSEDISVESDTFEEITKLMAPIGVSEAHAVNQFTRFKYDIAHHLIGTYWNALGDDERNRCAESRAAMMALDIYVSNGVPFSSDHLALLAAMTRFVKRLRKKRWPGL